MNKVQAKLIEEIEENEDQLTDWERKFIDSITANEFYTLTEKQNSVVNRIHHRVVFG